MTMLDSVLSADVLQHCGERAPIYDRDNTFFFEDLEELRPTGYLQIAVPSELGGGGLNLAQVCEAERALAYRSPATALALNMHIYWTGLAADLWRAGDRSTEWILRESVDGEVFAAGHGEVGNDLPLLLAGVLVPDAHVAGVLPAGFPAQIPRARREVGAPHPRRGAPLGFGRTARAAHVLATCCPARIGPGSTSDLTRSSTRGRSGPGTDRPS